MPEERQVFALDEGKNSWLTMTKEQILTAIMQAVNDGAIGDIDAGFVTKLQEMNKELPVQLWLGTSAEFNALESKEQNTLYILTDDQTPEVIEDLANKVAGLISGSTPAGNANNAINAETVNGIPFNREGDEPEIYSTHGCIGQAEQLFYSSLGVNIGVAYASEMKDVFTANETLVGTKLRALIRLSNNITNVYADFRIDSNQGRVTAYQIADFDTEIDCILFGCVNFGITESKKLTASAYFNKIDQAWSHSIESFGCKVIGIWKITD